MLTPGPGLVRKEQQKFNSLEIYLLLGIILCVFIRKHDISIDIICLLLDTRRILVILLVSFSVIF